MFKVGDLAVYPAHGVGRIEAIENKDFSGLQQSFYMMRILENDMIIMIPTDNVSNVGLREIIEPEEVSQVYTILKEQDISLETQNWNRRYREYMDKIKTGSVFEVAMVLRDLILLKAIKELSFGERKMLDTALNLLVKEISAAEDLTESKVESKILGCFRN
ncbi:MAG: CarD family transcriptional regulator [Deltaproteobacteria bacterium]|nr:CarD family transcriptional regulator [Deltaproteobacteria bacterium]MBW2051822.1 CarD family transcriptional regulator [Deltaproteobacteria bacterium]MBW2140695.1 CarD family transcriptional regulator [Deltaproteobacteria bacterium]MBW2322434.1 CarD family transcriptional regulator [Deltaproteobacteria bacterium]